MRAALRDAASADELAPNGVIELEHLGPALASRTVAGPAVDELAPAEVRPRDELRTILATHHGNIAAVARAMSVARMQVHRWVKRDAIDISELRKQ